jgi:hypothetical protein
MGTIKRPIPINIHPTAVIIQFPLADTSATIPGITKEKEYGHHLGKDILIAHQNFCII